MNTIYKAIHSFLVTCLITHGNAFGACKPETQTLINEAKPYALFGIIDAAKINAFYPETFIEKGLSSEELAQWDDLIECCNLFVTQHIEKNMAHQKYQNYMAQLAEATDFIKNSIRTLHKRFSQLKTDEASFLQKLQQLTKNTFSPQDQQYLYALKNEMLRYHKTISIILGTILKTINLTVPTQPEWNLKVPAQIEAFFPCYKKFFESYDTAKKSSGGKTLNAQELIYFINITNIFHERCLKDIHFDDVSKAAALVDVLEKINYRLEEEIKKSSLTKEQANMLAASKEIIEGLFAIYPQMITDTYFKKLSLTNDKASIILFAQAKSLLSVLEDLQKEVNKILLKLKNNR